MRHARIRPAGRPEPVYLRLDAGAGSDFTGFEPIPADGWLPPHSGFVYGVLLNDRASLDVYGARMTAPPHVQPPVAPVLYFKPYNTHVGHQAVVELPNGVEKVEIGATVGIVFGATASRTNEHTALEAVAGYTLGNDISMRDYQYKTAQWLPGKNWAASTPLGPFLVTPDEVGDPHQLDISLELNGERMQSANTSQLIFDVPTLVATISEFVPLAPGDVVLTGTPSGVGYRRDPKVLLRDGDRVVVEIERVGRLENPVAAER